MKIQIACLIFLCAILSVSPLGAEQLFGTKGPFAKDIVYLAIHHTEVRASDNGYQFDAVNEYHRRRFGNQSFLRKWGGYNAFIDVDGTLTWYRLYGEKSAAQLAHNFDTLSVCMAGNFNTDMPTDPQVKTLAKFLYEHSSLVIVFHRDLADRTCPGTNLSKQWLQKILEENKPLGGEAPRIHMGVPNLSADDSVLRALEHRQSRERYLELLRRRDDSEVCRFERAKLKSIVDSLDNNPSPVHKRKSKKKGRRR